MGAETIGWKDVGDDARWAAEHVVDEGKKIVGQGCLNIKRTAQRIVRDNSPIGYLPHYPRSISYEVTAAGADITGEVGPNRAKTQGGLGSYIEYGTIHNAPIPHLNPGLDQETPRFEHYVAELGERLLQGEGAPGAGPVADPGGG